MNNSEILIYQNSEGNIKIDVRLEEESVWLTQAQLCELFQKSSHYSKHPIFAVLHRSAKHPTFVLKKNLCLV